MSTNKENACMRLIHYTDNPIESLEQKDYSQSDLTWQAKPNGLWFSAETLENLPNNYNWKEWCIDQNYCIESLAISYEIILKEEADILHLKTEEGIIEFTKQYPLRTGYGNPEFDTHHLHWDKVKSKYQGIIISPYQWNCRLSLQTCWYYGWDCSSGCIWDLNCIKEFSRQEIKEINV